MDKVITIDGKNVGFRATALTPRLYRHKFKRDIMQDLNQLRKAYNKAANLPENATEEEKTDAQIDVIDLEIFENVAWLMARQYDNSRIPDSPDDWLDSFSTFSIYVILPEILDLWIQNQITTSKPKNG